ncbi:peptidoglycan-associated lipoprotein Pal [Geobacter argillaceus]|uniref:Peptidoglycan-associated protein n=1 Tax=Geobacter argillaceus TaxID=345631 RepID=A0A562VFN2_9BACT|nr:peptidoglycan-associated lipoprotein Pal [Geobacter argillaceus]TWJ16685.1 peptidoglycan-associated lipoprotein [Geobacter argillaceus]
MKIFSIRLLPVVCALMFMYSGCAKQELVKKDEPLVAPIAATPKQGAATAGKPIAATTVTTSTLNSGAQQKSSQDKVSAVADDLRKAIEKIYFDFDSSTLSDTARQTLTKNSALLKQNPRTRIVVEGHCDERGSDEYNLALGERRAQAAVHYLKTLGVQADRLSTISYGKEKPADPGHNDTAWAKNRRDEFVVSK